MAGRIYFDMLVFLVGGCGGMADASDSKSDGGNIVWVQVPPSAVFVLY